MENKILRCAVIGCGYISHEHIEAYINNKNSTLIALCNRNEEWLKHEQQKYSVKYAYTDYKELLKNPEIDVVSICTPNKLHCEMTIAALEAGKHVLCEKPMAANAREAKAMIAARDRTGKELMIVQNQRFIPAAQIMREMNRKGDFGEIYHIRTGWRRHLGLIPSPEDTRETGQITNRNWYNEKESCGGVLRDLGVHLLDLAMYITDFPKVKSVAANAHRRFSPQMTDEQKERFSFTSEDIACALITFENGMTLSLEVSFGSPLSEESLFTVIYGDKGGAERSFDDLKLIRTEDTFSYSVEDADFKTAKPFTSCADEFIDALVSGREIPVKPEECLKVIELLDLIYSQIEKI